MTPDQATLEGSDLAARQQALDVTRSVLLQAPAGSGKTTVLVCRLLALLAVVDEPEEVLAITFTRKAAAEMRSRVLQALRAAATAADDPLHRIEAPLARAALAHAQTRGWQLLSLPARLRIHTIDALNLQLATSCPILSRGGAAFEVANRPGVLYRRAARQTLAACMADAQLLPAAELLLQRLDNQWSRLEALLAEMLERRAHWLPHVLDTDNPQLVARVESGLRAVIGAELQAVSQAIPLALLQRGAQLTAEAARLVEGDALVPEAAEAAHAAGAPLRAEPADLLRWRWLCRVALTAEGEWRKSFNKRVGLPPQAARLKQLVAEWAAGLAQLPGAAVRLRAVQQLPDATLTTDEQDALMALSAVLQRAAMELQLEFAASGAVDLPYLAAAARQALTTGGEPTDLALRVGVALRHILVDEFQDTSAGQVELLQALTAGWSTGDGRTLFAVGDPMQSIYLFREADVGLFLRTRERGLGDLRPEALELQRNFRSGPGVVEWINERFAQLFPPLDDLRRAAIRYLPSVSARPEIQAAVHVHASSAHDAAGEARQIVELVRQRRSRDPQASIAVLVANRRHAAHTVAALISAGFAVRGIRLQPLVERHAVRDQLALARALQHPGDRTAWLALLHSPLCGLELPDLQQLAEDQSPLIWQLLDDERLACLAPDARARLLRLRAALAPAVDGAERLERLWSRVDRCWLRLGGSAVYGSARDLEDCRTVLRALAEERDAECLAGSQLQTLVEDLFASAQAEAGAIDVLTMHSAKGLEWDVVVVPALGRRGRPDQEPLLQWLDLPAEQGGSDLLLAPISPATERGVRSLADYLMRLKSERALLECARLLYVTATRARSELHWFGHGEPVAGGGWRAPGGSLLRVLWPAVAGEFTRQLADAVPCIREEPSSLPRVLQYRLPATWQPDPPASLAVARLPLSLHQPDAEPEYSWVGQSARAVGTIVHAELQRAAERAAGEPLAWPVAEHYLPWLGSLGVAMAERPAAARRIAEALSRTAADARGQWLLSGANPGALSEARLTGVYEGQIVSVSIDRMLLDDAGVRWVVDFKTSSHEGSGLEQFIDSEVARYRPQLLRYAALAKQLGSEPVRTALYFPLLGVYREVS